MKMTRDEFKQLLKEALIELAEEGYLPSKADLKESKGSISQAPKIFNAAEKANGLRHVAEMKSKTAKPLIQPPQPQRENPFSGLGAFSTIFEDTAKTTLVEQIQAETRGYTDKQVEADKAQITALVSPEAATQFKKFFSKKKVRTLTDTSE